MSGRGLKGRAAPSAMAGKMIRGQLRARRRTGPARLMLRRAWRAEIALRRLDGLLGQDEGCSETQLRRSSMAVKTKRGPARWAADRRRAEAGELGRRLEDSLDGRHASARSTNGRWASRWLGWADLCAIVAAYENIMHDVCTLSYL